MYLKCVTCIGFSEYVYGKAGDYKYICRIRFLKEHTFHFAALWTIWSWFHTVAYRINFVLFFQTQCFKKNVSKILNLVKHTFVCVFTCKPNRYRVIKQTH